MKLNKSDSIDNKALLHDSSNRSDHYIEKKGESTSKTKQLGIVNSFRSCGRSMGMDKKQHESILKSLEELTPVSSSNKEDKEILVDWGWKSAFDDVTQKRYFYNKQSKEVTWTKPPSFVEWKTFMDRSTQKYYYYNTLTNETTWDRPKELVKGWNLQSVDNNTKNRQITFQEGADRKAHLPSYLSSYNQIMPSSPHFDSLQVVNTTTTNKNTNVNENSNVSTIESQWKAFYDNLSGKHVFYNIYSHKLTWTKPDGFQEWVKVRASSTNRDYFYNLLTGESTWSQPTKDKKVSMSQFDKENYSLDGKGIIVTQQDETNGIRAHCPRNEATEKKLKGGLEIEEDFQDFASKSIGTCLEDFERPYDEKPSSTSSTIIAKVPTMSTACSPEQPYDEQFDRLWKSYHFKREDEEIEIPLLSSQRDDIDDLYVRSTKSSASHYLTKAIHLSGSSGRTVLFLPR